MNRHLVAAAVLGAITVLGGVFIGGGVVYFLVTSRVPPAPAAAEMELSDPVKQETLQQSSAAAAKPNGEAAATEKTRKSDGEETIAAETDVWFAVLHSNGSATLRGGKVVGDSTVVGLSVDKGSLDVYCEERCTTLLYDADNGLVEEYRFEDGTWHRTAKPSRVPFSQMTVAQQRPLVYDLVAGSWSALEPLAARGNVASNYLRTRQRLERIPLHHGPDSEQDIVRLLELIERSKVTADRYCSYVDAKARGYRECDDAFSAAFLEGKLPGELRATYTAIQRMESSADGLANYLYRLAAADERGMVGDLKEIVAAARRKLIRDELSMGDMFDYLCFMRSWIAMVESSAAHDKQMDTFWKTAGEPWTVVFFDDPIGPFYVTQADIEAWEARPEKEVIVPKRTPEELARLKKEEEELKQQYGPYIENSPYPLTPPPEAEATVIMRGPRPKRRERPPLPDTLALIREADALEEFMKGQLYGGYPWPFEVTRAKDAKNNR